MEIIICNNKEEIAKKFSEELQKIIHQSDKVNVALSGGSTPKAIFDFISENYKDSISWNNVHFYWGDERCVGPDDSESNFKMTLDHLFSKIDIPIENIHRIKGENDPRKEAIRYSKILNENLEIKNGIPCFDLLILGMGEDGHTASIFPDQMNLWNSDHNCEVATHPNSGQLRITITGKVINNAKTVTFLVTGLSKKEKIDEILNKRNHYLDFPAAHVQPISKNIIWYLDKESALYL